MEPNPVFRFPLSYITGVRQDQVDRASYCWASAVVGTVMDCAGRTFHSFARFLMGSVGATLDCGGALFVLAAALVAYAPVGAAHAHEQAAGAVVTLVAGYALGLK